MKEKQQLDYCGIICSIWNSTQLPKRKGMFQFTVYNFLRNLVLTEFEVIYETHVPSVKKRGFVTCSTDRENEISKKIMITQAFN